MKHYDPRSRFFFATRLAALAILLLAGLAGCAVVPRVYTEHDAGVDLVRYKTFTVLPLSTAGAGMDPGVVIRLGKPAEQAVRDALIARGYKEGTRDNADFAVHVKGESLPRVEPYNWGYWPYPAYVSRHGWVYYGNYYYGSPWMGGAQVYEERRLVVEIYDGTTHKPAWVGWVEPGGYGPMDVQTLQRSIFDILRNFPYDQPRK
ncbi:DUF4136 domain-containing protein [Methylococcus sp. EFPC2]|uniref:DUF4136 domain-containing protein n=1 Tax=Methylococcus sp. EFPC2 TaxID=2812648 RepID=UPI001966CECB|nr:DUF4136 domain-containing protein [Methylococcus sp. EFPC2]QSA95988.1 DUF4136 domain-containing protein [Methylococcus sp. EFPC2]